MPARGIHHIDLAVTDVARSLAFYRELLGPLGLEEDSRYQSYRGTEEVVYLCHGDQLLGLRPDGGEHRHYEVGVEHIAFYVGDLRAITSCSSSIRTGSGSRSAAGRPTKASLAMPTSGRASLARVSV